MLDKLWNIGLIGAIILSCLVPALATPFAILFGSYMIAMTIKDNKKD